MLAPGVSWTRIARGTRERGPRWRVHVLVVDRERFGGRVAAALTDGRVPGRDRVSRLSRRAGALAATNGGFFSPSGDPVGAVVADGRIVSEPTGGRTGLLVPRDPAERVAVAPLRFRGSVRAGERTRLLDGVNRPKGRIPACGGRGGDQPTQRPSTYLTCTDRSELVMYTRDYGARTPRSRGYEAAVRNGQVLALRRGSRTTIPRGGYVLSGSGGAASFLRSFAGEEAAVSVRADVGRGLRSAGYSAVIGVGPRLLRRGRLTLRAVVEGFVQSFVGLRAPRTLAGVRSDGRLVLVTVDGRRSAWSAGLTLLEAARVMRDLGAREALNLDGGGSTTMAVRGRLVNRPSDDGGERRVGDALLVLP